MAFVAAIPGGLELLILGDALGYTSGTNNLIIGNYKN